MQKKNPTVFTLIFNLRLLYKLLDIVTQKKVINLCFLFGIFESTQTLSKEWMGFARFEVPASERQCAVSL
jgi:hypothetical protein